MEAPMAESTFHVYPDPDDSGMFIAKSPDHDLVVRAPNRSHAQRHVLEAASNGQHDLSEETSVLFEHHQEPQTELHNKVPSYLGRSGVDQSAPVVGSVASAPVVSPTANDDDDR